MKNLIKFSIVMAVLCITACTQTFENTSNEVQKKAQGRLVMKVGNESRTIKPAIGESDVKTAVLTANGEEIKSWTSDNIISQIQSTEDILLDVGNYDFTMTFRNAGNIDILTATISQEIVTGDNILKFDMKPVTTGTGDISITLTWDDPSEIYTITAGLYDIANNTPVEDFADSELEITSTEEQTPIATYSKNAVPVGSYIIKFKSYKDNILLNTSTDVIKVAAGITTSTQITLSKINRQYTITYNLSDGKWADGFTATEDRNGNKKIVLPTAEKIIRDGYKFDGWYDDNNNKITEIPSDTMENIYVTAKWLQLYTITYNLNGGENNTNNPTSYTVETETIILGTPTKNSSTFLGWYNDSGEVITEIKPSETAANITVTARWRTTCTAQDVNGVITSLSVDGPHDIVVTGEITSATIATIKSTLDTLKQDNNTAKVNLDLSGTTVLTSIDNEAFKDCTNLTSIIIPEGVTSIGDSAFSHCSQLTSITFPESVTTIGINVFDACSELTSFIVHESNQNFSTLEDGKILCDKNKETLIAYPSASGSITILNGIKTIAGNAFIECKGLTEISIPDSVTTICDGAFANTGFTSVSLPNSITEIGINVFFGCSSLKTVKLPNRITSIPTGTFFVCSSLSNIEIPDDVTSIGGDAFSYCNSVKTLVIGNSLTSFEFLPIAKDALESITIGNGITEIGENKFKDFTNLKSVTIGSGVTKIGTSAFENCTGLTSVTFGSGVTTINDNAFSGCTGLTSVEIPNNVTNISASAFYSCSNLAEFIVSIEHPAYSSSEDKKVLYNKDKTTLFAYPSATGEFTIPDNVTTIGNRAFAECKGLTSVTIPEGITTIENNAFDKCSGLTSVVLPNSITEMGINIFWECSNLKTVKLPNRITSIPDSTFFLCGSLSNIEIPEGVTSIKYDAFANCSSLTSIVIPASVTSIIRGAFYNSGLTTVNYRGTEDQWEQIVIDSSYNDKLINATKNFNYKEE